MSQQLLSSRLVKPYLQLDSYKHVNLPIQQSSPGNISSIIKDFIHLQHPELQHLKAGLIDKTSTHINNDEQEHTLPFLSPRKSHELVQFNNQIMEFHKDHPFEFIMDVAAGNSNLSRLHKFPTIAIEKDPRSQKASKRITGLLTPLHVQDDIHYTENFTLDDPETQRFIKSRQRLNTQKPRCLIVGLDCCGDLPLNIMEMCLGGIEGLDIVGCCFVSCCFHKVTKLSQGDGPKIRFDRFGTSDLRLLSEDEILQRYTLECGTLRDMDQFAKWCYWYGVLTNVIESVVLLDRSEYLKAQGLDVEVCAVFQFEKSSRNIQIRGVY